MAGARAPDKRHPTQAVAQPFIKSRPPRHLWRREEESKIEAAANTKRVLQFVRGDFLRDFINSYKK